MTADEFKTIRASLKMTQNEMSDLLHITQSSVAQFESGSRKIPGYINILLQCIVFLNDEKLLNEFLDNIRQ